MLEDHHHSELARLQATKKKKKKIKESSKQHHLITPQSLSLHIYTHTPLWLCITSPLDHKLNRRLWCFFTMTVFSGSGITQLANICRTKPFAQSHTQLRFKPHLLESNEHSEQPVPASLTAVWSEACLYSCNVPQLPQLQENVYYLFETMAVRINSGHKMESA